MVYFIFAQPLVHFSKNLSNDNKAKGFTREVDEENVLGVGEVVIIDKDFIYDLDKCSMDDIDFWNDLATYFENRYQLEKNERRGKKI